MADCVYQFHSLSHDVGDDLLHEKYAMLIMKSHLSMEEFLVAGVQGAASVEQQVMNQPDDTAASLRENMDFANISLSDHCSAVGLLLKMFFDELGFTVYPRDGVLPVAAFEPYPP